MDRACYTHGRNEKCLKNSESLVSKFGFLDHLKIAYGISRQLNDFSAFCLTTLMHYATVTEVEKKNLILYFHKHLDTSLMPVYVFCITFV
jgi:hypothetical protein